jgi:hypothetical protein
MREELHRHLDGELPADDLEVEDREAADEWDRMVAAFRTASPRGQAPPWLEQKVMANIERLPRSGLPTRLWGWLTDSASIRVSPLTAGLATAAFALVIMLPRQGVGPLAVDTPDEDVATESVIYVQFILDAPAATTVAVAGDFSEWEPSFSLEDVDGDGVWTGRVPIRPGVHGYMFLIDGTEWQTDPRADRYQDDGFGNQNAILAVAAGA